MRISFRVPGYIYDKWTDQSIRDSVVLSTLDGWRYDGGNMYNYISSELAEQGIVGGDIRASWTSDRGLEVVTDYWMPDASHTSYINQLRDETIGQLSDGIGEGGFEITLDGQDVLLVADTDKAPDIERLYDGKPLPILSKIAVAARDGNIPLLEDAIDAGEPIDSTIQGRSGLHLAITYGHVDAALFLISKGANPNLVVADGDETPLHLCALSNSLGDMESALVAKALLERGADQLIRATSGNTAASFAQARHKIMMLRILREEKV
jgi:hypothetical protein